MPIRNHKVGVPGAPYIGFLAELYPEAPDFALPMVALLDLHKAWQHYHNGTTLAVLGRRLHPFYGTYAPTRVSHLELFGTWLSQYGGGRVEAVDVGTG